MVVGSRNLSRYNYNYKYVGRDGQDRFIMRELDDAEVGLGEDCEEVLADVGNNADLYVANQESADLISEAYMEDIESRFMGQDLFYFQPLSLD